MKKLYIVLGVVLLILAFPATDTSAAESTDLPPICWEDFVAMAMELYDEGSINLLSYDATITQGSSVNYTDVTSISFDAISSRGLHTVINFGGPSSVNAIASWLASLANHKSKGVSHFNKDDFPPCNTSKGISSIPWDVFISENLDGLPWAAIILLILLAISLLQKRSPRFA